MKSPVWSWEREPGSRMEKKLLIVPRLNQGEVFFGEDVNIISELGWSEELDINQ